MLTSEYGNENSPLCVKHRPKSSAAQRDYFFFVNAKKRKWLQAYSSTRLGVCLAYKSPFIDGEF